MNKNILLSIVICSMLSVICQAQWLPDVRLSNLSNEDKTSLNNARSIVSNGSDVHVFWMHGTAGVWHIKHKHSTNEGLTWGELQHITNEVNEMYPAVCLSGTVNPVIHLAWMDGRYAPNWEIYYKRSTDGGLTWGSEKRLTDGDAYSSYPSIAASGSTVHIVWSESITARYKRSTDGGVSWGTETVLDYTPSGAIPSISLSGTYIHAVWASLDEIYYRRSLSAGAAWEPVTRLTYDSAFSRSPCISVSEQDINVVWYDTRDGNPEIYFKKSRDGGLNWEADQRLSISQSYSSYNPSLFSSGSIINVVWYDIYYDDKILYKKSLNGGVSWGTEVVLTDEPGGESFNPSVSAFGTAVHVIWTDTRDANSEIYYKRNPTGNSYIYKYPKYNVNKLINDFQNTFDTINVNINDLPDPFYAADVNITIDTVLHTNDSDLEFTLIHAGVTDTIIYRSGGTGDNFILTELDDSASTPIANGTAPFTGLFRPHKPLSQFNNLDVTGNWILKVYDRTTGNTGILKAWSLTLILQTTIGIEPIGNEIPIQFLLYQNYPNPFNPTTHLRFEIPKGRSDLRFVKLEIFDILGREVTALVNEQLQPGTYEVEFDGSNYTSGVYFCKLIADGYSDTKKMILIK